MAQRERERGNERKLGASSPKFSQAIKTLFGAKQKRRVLKSLPRYQAQLPTRLPPPASSISMLHWEQASGSSSLAPNARCNSFCTFCCSFHGGLSRRKCAQQQQESCHTHTQHTIYYMHVCVCVCVLMPHSRAASDGLLELAERWKIKITAPVSERFPRTLTRCARTSCLRKHPHKGRRGIPNGSSKCTFEDIGPGRFAEAPADNTFKSRKVFNC